MNSLKNKCFLAVTACCLVWSVETFAQGFEKTIPAPDKASITVSMKEAAVQVTGWDRNEINIKAKKDISAGIIVDGDNIRISYKDADGKEVAPDTDLVLQVPSKANITVATISGDLVIKAMKARTKIKAISGDVVMESCSGKITTKTISGDLKLSKISGGLTIKAISGDVRGQDLQMDLFEVKSVSGDVKLIGVKADEVRLKSVSGDMSIAGEFSATSSVRSATVSGDITLYLPAGAGFDVNTKTRSGNFHSDFDLKNLEQSGSSRSGTVGAGGTDISLTSLSGDFSLRKSR